MSFLGGCVVSSVKVLQGSKMFLRTEEMLLCCAQQVNTAKQLMWIDLSWVVPELVSFDSY